MKYSVAIRTLGKAGEKYQTLLNSLKSQTVAPEKVFVYLAEGYQIPAETAGIEEYVYVKKGMVAQRALQYSEIDTDYILFADDDLYLPPTAVETLFRELDANHGDVISPEVFENGSKDWKTKLSRAISGRMCPRFNDAVWANKVMRNACFSYNNRPDKGVYLSQTNSGPCFLCRKETFLSIRFEDELWLDNLPYALNDDQTMYYKMYLNNLKVLTSFDSGIVHLDAGSTMANSDKVKTLAYCDFYSKTVFWKKFILDKESSLLLKAVDCLAVGYTFGLLLLSSLVKFEFDILKIKLQGIKDGRKVFN